MNLVQIVALSMVFIVSFMSCQSTADPKQTLSNTDSRKAFMETIAKDAAMSKEMMQTMMANADAHKMMMEHHAAMMKDDPSMMKGMMADMMEACKKDTSMMSEMCKKMMDNQPMMDKMHEMNGEKMDMKKMEGMNHKM